MTNNILYMEIVGTSNNKVYSGLFVIQSYVCVRWPKLFWDRISN